MPFKFQKLEIPDVILIEAQSFGDDRGFLAETYRRSEFAAHGIPPSFVQDNYSFSVRGVLRGLHYQKKPQAQGKLVTAIRGQIFDVAVDIRRGSPTYGKWVGRVLGGEQIRLLYIPPGFAHGFCVLTENAAVTYKITQEYAPELERGIIWNDPFVGVQWPIAEPILSPRDLGLPLLEKADLNFEYDVAVER
jgi:dTDP-4-dehydrorhamnose 3,5-epimerase